MLKQFEIKPKMIARKFLLFEFSFIGYAMFSTWMHQVVADYDPSVCKFHEIPAVTAERPVFPPLPNSMRSWIEVKDAYSDYTFDVESVFDRGDDLKMAYNIRSYGYSAHLSFNFVTSQTIYTSADGFCFVTNFTTTTATALERYGLLLLPDISLLVKSENLKLQADLPHIIPDVLQIDDPTYLRMDTVHEMPVTKWSTCLYVKYNLYDFDGTVNITMFISAPGYKMPSGDDQIPVLYVLNGTIISDNRGPSDILTYLTYFDVVVNPIIGIRTFEPLLGVVCSGRISQTPFPTDWPETFTINAELQSPNIEWYQDVKEYYSSPDNIIAYEYQSWGVVKVGDFMRTVHDYNSGLSYDIDMNTGVCFIGPIPVDSGEAISPDGKHVYMSSIKGFLNLKNLYWVYEGQSYQRDILTESWIVTRADWPASLIQEGWAVNSTWEYFFAASDWQTPAKFHQAVSHLPILLKIHYTLQAPPDVQFPYNYTVYINEHLYNLFLEPFAPALVDVSLCFDTSDSLQLAFDFQDLHIFDTYVVNNTNNFYSGVVSSVAEAANVSVTRITNPLAAQGSDGQTTFVYTLLGTPPVDGNAFNASEQTSLDEAYHKFATAVSQGFSVRFRYQTTWVTLPVDSDSVRQEFSGNNTGFSAGAMAGMAVGMLAAGVLISVSVGFALFRSSTGPFSSKTQ